MKIAISTDGEYVSAHFGRCPLFTIVNFKNGEIVEKEIINNPGHHPGFLPQFFKERGIECIIAGGMGNKAKDLFDQYQIQQIVGVTGKIDDAISQIMEGSLKGGESLCNPGGGKGYGVDKRECDHGGEQ
jgi:predicted Fe-Mo cluster-binding NifX family protein